MVEYDEDGKMFATTDERLMPELELFIFRAFGLDMRKDSWAVMLTDEQKDKLRELLK